MCSPYHFILRIHPYTYSGSFLSFAFYIPASSAIYRSPRACVPWWVSVWITRTPLMFLVASVIAFSAGLVCFTFSNFGAGSYVPIVTTVSTSISSFALFAVGFWFAGERYAFGKTKGRKVGIIFNPFCPLWISDDDLFFFLSSG